MNNYNSNPNQTLHQPNQAPSAWDQLGDNPEIEQHLREQRKNKLVNAVLYGPTNTERLNTPVTPADEDTAFNALAGQNPREARELRSNLIQALAPSAIELNPDQATNQLRSNPHYARILAAANGGNIGDPQPVDQQALAAFIAEYPTPVDFEPTKLSFLAFIGERNNPAKYEQYATDAAEFENTVYGERQAYFEALQDLENDAMIRNQQRATAESQQERANNHANLVASQRQLVEETYQNGYHDENPYAAPEMRADNSDTSHEAPKKKPGLFSRFFGRKK